MDWAFRSTFRQDGGFVINVSLADLDGLLEAVPLGQQEVDTELIPRDPPCGGGVGEGFGSCLEGGEVLLVEGVGRCCGVVVVVKILWSCD